MDTSLFKYPVILDGGTGSELIKLGMPAGVCTEQWVMDNPQAIIRVQSAYVSAGSTAILTPTFHCNSHCLDEYGLGGKTRQYNVALAKLSREASGGKAAVIADLSPAALLIKPIGTYDFEYIYDVYARQVQALEEAGVDGYLIETVMTMAEMRAIALAVRDNSDKPLFVTFTVNINGRTQMSGTDILAGLITLQSMGVDAFGMNCSMGASETLTQLRRIAPYTEIPLIAKPNAGMPVVKDGKTEYNCSPSEFASYTAALAQCGVRFFGGCCGTDPEYIRALKTELDKLDFSGIEPVEKQSVPVMLAGEKDAYLLQSDPEIKTIKCSEDMGDECDGFDGIVKLDVSTPEELDVFADNAYTLTCPLCLTGSSPEIYEKALRLYQGRACYDGSGRLESAFIRKMQDRYGLLVLGE